MTGKYNNNSKIVMFNDLKHENIKFKKINNTKKIYTMNNIQKNEFLLSIAKLNLIDRARILYNHIWFSNLPENYINELYLDKRYMIIIKHSNFNPRLIEFITDIERLDITYSHEYWSYIENTMNGISVRCRYRSCFRMNPILQSSQEESND